MSCRWFWLILYFSLQVAWLRWSTPFCTYVAYCLHLLWSSSGPVYWWVGWRLDFIRQVDTVCLSHTHIHTHYLSLHARYVWHYFLASLFSVQRTVHSHICVCPSVCEWVYCTSSFPGQVTVWNDNLALLQMSHPEEQWQMTADYICRLSSRGLTRGGRKREIWNIQPDEDMSIDKERVDWRQHSVEGYRMYCSSFEGDEACYISFYSAIVITI